METVIKNGFVIDPKNKIYSKLNIGIKDGHIEVLSKDPVDGEIVIDAEGLIVCPGFIDAEKMTYLTANRYGLHNKGSISIGDDADIVIFNFDSIIDNATFESPSLPPAGIRYVIVNGKVAVQDNRILMRNLGKSVRK